MSNLDDASFDIVILGTGLTESIIAAALSKASYKVAHIDANPYYGANEATLSQEELISWGEAVNKGLHPTFSGFTGSTTILPHSRQYSICLRPSILPALGPLISSLVGSGVSKYSEFKLLQSVSIFTSNGSVKSVPGSKEDVFNNKDISLIEKRRLMRFLTFVAGEFEDKPEIQGREDVPFPEFLRTTFSLSEDIASVIAYSLAHCAGPSERTLPALLRLREYVRSIGRYGPSPFLVGQYGGIGDISQGFCRAAAVSGAVYILGRSILSAQLNPEDFPEYPITFSLDDFPESLHCKLVICSTELKPSALDAFTNHVQAFAKEPSPPLKLARGIVIIDRPLYFTIAPDVPSLDDGEEARPAAHTPPVDSSILVFPPSSVEGGSTSHSATVHITGDGSLSTPKGKYTLYFILPLGTTSEEHADTLLKPYVDTLLSLPSNGCDRAIEPISTAFYFENARPSTPPSQPNDTPPEDTRCLIVPPLDYTVFPDLPDTAARNAEAVFKQAAFVLRSIGGIEGKDGLEEPDFWPPIAVEEEDDDSDS